MAFVPLTLRSRKCSSPVTSASLDDSALQEKVSKASL